MARRDQPSAHDRRRRDNPPAPRRTEAAQAGDAFTCGHCGRFVGPLPSGGRNRNHCPFCLYSRHVDAERSGDRASACKGMMEPIGVFERLNGEEVIVHRCVKCGFERFNRVGADDDEALVIGLPRVEPRSAPRPDAASGA
ncbi:MAG TPA: RNHCP domain-containing protein [Ktedonobacterales bacterium]|nr:RNHCP domain-containing protein [Ktedonobacterales bacterium]